MDTSLATNGLPELSFSGVITTDTVGGASNIVASACENLDDYATNLDSFIMDLESQKEDILKGWEGNAADMLRQCFPDLIEAFRQVPPSVRSISSWATSSMSRKVARDSSTAEKISQIMGGAR